jgi:YD repeat-containing protein
MRSRTRLLLTFCSLLAVGTYLAAQSQIRYIYDELGRLVGVIDQNGDAAAYHYDAVGNLLSITRTGASQVAIIEFTPNDGPIGGTVTIHGTGFSTTPSQNTVTFNGTAATVVSATGNTLVVTIPSGATSGQLSITTPAGSTSAAFLISVVAAPSITSFSPTVGTAGTSITVTGTGFEATPIKNNLRFNVLYALVNSATTSQISTTVPAFGTSGRIAVATPRGSATSSQDFFVPPTPYVAADVLVADRMGFSQDKVVTMSSANKIGLVLFDLAAGQRASLKISSVTITLSNISIRAPHTETAASVAVATSGGFIDPITAVVAGTYTVVVDPGSTNTGNATLRLFDVPPDLTGTISADGNPVTVSATVPGQNIRRTFSGVAGQRVSLKTSGSSFPGASISIQPPTGGALASTAIGGFIDTLTLPVNGTYTVLVDPALDSLNSVTVTLYDVPADVTGTISIGGSAVPVNITTPGQNGLLTFSGTAGQRVSLTMVAGALTSGTATIRKPDASTLASGSFGNGTSLVEPATLPTTGTYSIFVDPLAASTGTITLTLNSVPADITGTITPGGSPVLVTLTAPGQKARLTFTGSANQRVSLSGTTGPVGTLALLKPDDTTLASTTTGPVAAFIDVKVLPSAGTYTVLVDPFSASTGSITVTLYNVPADVAGTVTVGGSSVPVTTTVPGQNGSLTFSGTASQQVTVLVTGNTIGSVTVKLLRPDGTTMTTTLWSSDSFNLATQTLPTTGTYTITIDPSQTNTGTMNVQVTNP